MTLNIPPDVWGWFRGLELASGASKTRLTVAAIAALRVLGDTERDAMIQWATLLDEERTSWTEFEQACEETAKKRGEAVKRIVEGVLKSEIEGHQQGKAASASAGGRKPA